jgi:hypothetical protein
MMAETILIDQRWLDHEALTCLYHPECVAVIAKHYHWKPAEIAARYRPFLGTLALGTKCDYCHRPVLFAYDLPMKKGVTA